MVVKMTRIVGAFALLGVATAAVGNGTQADSLAKGYPPAGAFSPGEGTGKPTAKTIRLLRLMKDLDTGWNSRDRAAFFKGHAPNVKVFHFGSAATSDLETHWAETQQFFSWSPDARVHNDPYDIQFGQGDWTVALGKLSGSFSGPMKAADGTVIQPTGRPFVTTFTTIARWKDDRIIEEYVLYDRQDIMRQIMAEPTRSQPEK